MNVKKNAENPEREIGDFDINIINVMTHLYKSGAVEDGVMETLRKLNYDYHTLLDKNEILQQKINIDEKTNLLKYRDDYLTMIIKSAWRFLDAMPREKYYISYVRFDIDDFSKLNNRFGHDKGDIALVDMAKLLKENSRPTDYIIRFGGEEFDVILPSTDLKGTITYLNKIFKRARGLKYKFDRTDIAITVSAGAAQLVTDFKKMKSIKSEHMRHVYMKLQKAADDALYDAKLSGKNQYKVYSDKIDYREIRRRYLDTG